MTRKYLKHLVLFFLAVSVIVGAADESPVDTDNSKGYDEADYEKIGHIGSGSYGIVSKIQEKKTGKIYALKTQKKEGCSHATKEINALKQLDHENIVKMITNNTKNRHKGDFLCIVLEYIPFSLYYIVENKKHDKEIKENRKRIFFQILKGIAHIHGKKLTHGDLKPRNILIDLGTMSVKICDFGICIDFNKEKYSKEKFAENCRKDILCFGSLITYVYNEMYYLECFNKKECDDFEDIFKTGIYSEENYVGKVYRKMKSASKTWTEFLKDLFMIEEKSVAAAEALKHPFFDEVRELDTSMKQGERNNFLAEN
ncbi:MAG: CMGC/CDK protein kinase [Amphiamblys sp. WSBS2006]|nr:MAG: CMGC/CDK protein kinase [Amphiamblys sp. WSBS2006]